MTKAKETNKTAKEALANDADLRRPDTDIPIDNDDLTPIEVKLNQSLTGLIGIAGNVQITPAERRRLQGARARRWGFIERTTEIAQSNLRYAPLDWNYAEMRTITDQVQKLRAMDITVDQISRIIKDLLLQTTNEAYRMALLYYGSVQNFARRHDQAAMELFSVLQEFFRNNGIRTTEKTPVVPKPLSKKQQLKDARAIIEGKKEGKMIIENEFPHVEGGSHEVIDDVHKPINAFVEAQESVICPQCHTQNFGHHKFCNECGAKLIIEEK
jgi:hypothetical protein